MISRSLKNSVKKMSSSFSKQNKTWTTIHKTFNSFIEMIVIVSQEHLIILIRNVVYLKQSIHILYQLLLNLEKGL